MRSLYPNDEQDCEKITIHTIRCHDIPIGKQREPMCHHLNMKGGTNFIDAALIIFEHIYLFEGKIWNYSINISQDVINIYSRTYTQKNILI